MLASTVSVPLEEVSSRGCDGGDDAGEVDIVLCEFVLH